MDGWMERKWMEGFSSDHPPFTFSTPLSHSPPPTQNKLYLDMNSVEEGKIMKGGVGWLLLARLSKGGGGWWSSEKRKLPKKIHNVDDETPPRIAETGR
jgi:hypothetical protein